MRLNNILSRVLLILSITLAVACQSLTPSLSVGLTEMVVGGTGGKYEIDYSLEDIAFSSESWDFQCDAEWITGYDFSTNGVIVVDVLANEQLEERSTVINLSYSGVAEKYQVAVLQKAGSVDMSDIVLEQDEIEVSDEEGEYTVKYEIKNPIEGIGVTVEANAPWITSVRSNVDGEVTFKTSWNFAGVREAGITLVYGDKIERSFKVIQQEGVPENAFTEISISDITQNTALVRVVPKDNKMYYGVLFMPSADLDMAPAEEQVLSWLDGMKQIAGMLGYRIEDILRSDLRRGPTNNSLTQMPTDTEMSVLVFGMEPSDQSFLTEVFVSEFRTEVLEMVDDTYSIELDIEGGIVNAHVIPSNNDAFFFVDAVTPGVYNPQGKFDYLAWIYAVAGASMEETLDSLCFKGESTIEFFLEPEVDYVVYAASVNYQGLIYSEVETVNFTTGKTPMSDNEFTISASDVTTTSALISVDVTNDDFYSVAVLSPKDFDGMSDEEVIANLVATNKMMVDIQFRRGDAKDIQVLGLQPNTTYVFVAFGYYPFSQTGDITTAPTKFEFTTPSGSANAGVCAPQIKCPSRVETGLPDNEAVEKMRKRFEMERYLRMLGR